MGSNYSSLLTKEEIQLISSETGFDSAQIKRLYNRFTNLDKDNTGYLSRHNLISIPELHVNPLRDRIIDVIIEDYGQDDKINFRQFARVFSTFRRGAHSHNDKSNLNTANQPLNSKEYKLKFIFSIYDRDKDERINKTELLAILHMLVGANLPEEQMNAIAERTIAELADENDISTISYKKFCETLLKIDIDDKMSMKFLS